MVWPWCRCWSSQAVGLVQAQASPQSVTTDQRSGDAKVATTLVLLRRRWADGRVCQYSIVSREAGRRVEYRRQKSCMVVGVGCCVGQETRRSLPESLALFGFPVPACLQSFCGEKAPPPPCSPSLYRNPRRKPCPSLHNLILFFLLRHAFVLLTVKSLQFAIYRSQFIMNLLQIHS